MNESDSRELPRQQVPNRNRLLLLRNPKILGLIFGLVISVAAGYFAVSGVSWNEISEISGSINWVYAAGGVGALILADFLRSVRWMILLRTDRSIPLRLLFQIVMAGLLFNLLIPLRFGDVFRAVVLRKKLDISYGVAGASLVTERLFDVITLAIVFAVFAIGVSLPGYLIPVLAIFAFVAVVGVAAIFGAALFEDRLLAQVARLSRSRWNPVRKLASFLSEFVVGLSPLRGKKNFAGAWGFSFCIRISEVLAVGLVLSALDINIGIKGFGLVNSLTMLGLAIPSGPGAVGSFELLAKIGIETFNVSAAEALFGAVSIHAVHIVTTLVVGGVVTLTMVRQLRGIGLNLRSVTREGDAVSNASGDQAKAMKNDD